ncbi:uncharacterized protein PpBr36_11320 [Pyricularia pennisetigena]|uniref:uncharacterized protein n=1 Tax=Pyricularia pennisetigena TaxID=1578925 RepID=UPI0011542028|nr:uncharacterized protein PpBr36_11320 [Pyricularia pennisetigena]TLS20322.1 hypothetical protein PpBr36_11320 [Pyricularia pennisetigena]
MAAASVNSDNHQFSTISEVRSFSGIRECSTSAIARQEQREQIPIFNIQSTPGEMQNHELTRKHKTPGSPVDQPSKKRRTETYEVPKSPCQTSYAQESILEAFAQTTQPRSEQRLNDALEKRLKGISEELKRVSETQKKIESQISVDWPDLESRIHQQVRAEMTNVVLEARSTRRKAVSELRQELEKGSVLQNVPEFLRELNVEAKGSEHLPPKNRSAEYSITGSG